MQAFFAAKSEIFFFFSEGAPPKPRAVPAVEDHAPCPLPAAEDHAPRAPAPAAAIARLFLKKKKIALFCNKTRYGESHL